LPESLLYVPETERLGLETQLLRRTAMIKITVAILGVMGGRMSQIND
jgi:hypothetical protein